MKKIAVGIIAVLSLVLLQPVQAQPAKSIVIIDTAIDSSIPQLKAKLVQEVCILGSMVCPNGQKFQEGLGAATLPSAQALKGGFEHGTIMAYYLEPAWHPRMQQASPPSCLKWIRR